MDCIAPASFTHTHSHTPRCELNQACCEAWFKSGPFWVALLARSWGDHFGASPMVPMASGANCRRVECNPGLNHACCETSLSPQVLPLTMVGKARFTHTRTPPPFTVCIGAVCLPRAGHVVARPAASEWLVITSSIQHARSGCGWPRRNRHGRSEPAAPGKGEHRSPLALARCGLAAR
jgi:hypothetical protein